MTSAQIITDLQDFVTIQAAEDKVLPSGERKYQADLVKDVLGQEAPSKQAFEMLLKLYRSERQAA